MPSVGGSLGGVPWGRAEGRTLGLLPGPWRARGRARSRHARHCRTRGDLGSPPRGSEAALPHHASRERACRLWRGDRRLSPGRPRPARRLAATPHTSCPLSSRAWGGVSVNIQTESRSKAGRGVRMTGKGTQEPRQLPDEVRSSRLRGPRGVEPSGAEGRRLVPEVTRVPGAAVSTLLRGPGRVS